MVYICEDILDFDIEKALRLVSDERRAKVLSYRFEIDRRQSLAAYLLLMQALRREYGIATPPTFAYGDHGKPTLPNHPDIHFNLSHCRKGVACAIGDHPIGIDIEEITDVDWEVARHISNDGQLRAIATSVDPRQAFSTLWTTKESLLKFTGEGLCDNLAGLELKGYTFSHYTTRDYVCTTCRKEGPEPRVVVQSLLMQD